MELYDIMFAAEAGLDYFEPCGDCPPQKLSRF
jgi:hypothetical protein